MKTFIKLHEDIIAKVKFSSKQLKLKLCKSTGRPLAISGEETISLALFKQNTGIPTKKKIFEIFQPKESYKTLCRDEQICTASLVGIKCNSKMESKTCSHCKAHRLHRCSRVSQQECKISQDNEATLVMGTFWKRYVLWD